MDVETFSVIPRGDPKLQRDVKIMQLSLRVRPDLQSASLFRPRPTNAKGTAPRAMSRPGRVGGRTENIITPTISHLIQHGISA